MDETRGFFADSAGRIYYDDPVRREQNSWNASEQLSHPVFSPGSLVGTSGGRRADNGRRMDTGSRGRGAGSRGAGNVGAWRRGSGRGDGRRGRRAAGACRGAMSRGRACARVTCGGAGAREPPPPPTHPRVYPHPPQASAPIERAGVRRTRRLGAAGRRAAARRAWPGRRRRPWPSAAGGPRAAEGSLLTAGAATNLEISAYQSTEHAPAAKRRVGWRAAGRRSAREAAAAVGSIAGAGQRGSRGGGAAWSRASARESSQGGGGSEAWDRRRSFDRRRDVPAS